MRTFAPKQTPGHSAQCCGPRTSGPWVAPQPSSENRSRPRAPQHDPAGGSETDPLAAAPTFRGHDFGRIPVHHQKPAGARSPRILVSEPGDRHERDADRLADEILETSDSGAPASQRRPLPLREPCSHCGQEMADLRRSAREHPRNQPDVASKVGAVRGDMGRPLGRPERDFFEPRIGLDLGRVRIHDDSRADSAARAVDALAYTDRNRVVFRSGAYDPATRAGRHLLAHELAHVAQQGQPRAPSAPVFLQRKRTDQNKTCEISSGQKICCPKKKCATPDQPGVPGRANWWRLNILIDTDVPTIDEVTALTVGHVYVKFEDSTGSVWTYGLYPKSGIGMAYDRQSAGCMLHPDKIHEACVDYKLSINLPEEKFNRAIQFAQAACRQPHRFVTTHGGAKSPVYTCTTFARNVAARAGTTLPQGIATVRSSYMTSRAEWPNVLKSKLIEKKQGEYVGVQRTQITPAHQEFAKGYSRTMAQLTAPDPGTALSIRRFQLTASVPDLLRTSWHATLKRALTDQAHNERTLGRFEGVEARTSVALVAYLAGAAAALQLVDLYLRRAGASSWKQWAQQQRQGRSLDQRASRFEQLVLGKLRQGIDPNLDIRRVKDPGR